MITFHFNVGRQSGSYCYLFHIIPYNCYRTIPIVTEDETV